MPAVDTNDPVLTGAQQWSLLCQAALVVICELGVTVLTFNASAQEAEAGGSL